MSKPINRRSRNRHFKRLALDMAAEYGIDTPVARERQAYFIRCLREIWRNHYGCR